MAGWVSAFFVLFFLISGLVWMEGCFIRQIGIFSQFDPMLTFVGLPC